MIHYHGGRRSTWQVAVEIWKRRHALVSFADPQQIVIAAEVAQSFALDNGAFSVWKQGVEVNWSAYYEWVAEWLRHPGFDWAVIPDVIEGDGGGERCAPGGVAVRSSRRSPGLALPRVPRAAGTPGSRVAARGARVVRAFRTPKWWSRMQQIMETVCEGGTPKVKLHGLRMRRPAVCQHIPLASADSAGVSRGERGGVAGHPGAGGTVCVTSIHKDFHCDAAHFLPFVPEGHKCGRMHGHTYRVRAWCRGATDSRGMIVDYAEIAAGVGEVLELIDHRVLNEIPGLGNPTTEVLALWLYEQIKPGLPELFRIEVAESATTGCVYDGEGGV